MEELIGSQDQKLQLVKTSVLSGGPVKMMASQPELLSNIVDTPLSPGLPISTYINSFAQSETVLGGEVGFNGDANIDVDFSKAEDLFQLETKIDARRDHSLLKMALSFQEESFVQGIMSRYSLPTKRLAFIQRKSGSSLQPSTIIMSGQLGADNKEIVISCQVCGEMFNYLHRFQRHILTHPDPETKKFLCQVCGKRFNRADHLNRHSVLHGEVVHKCLLCGEEFDRASHLDRHRRKNHPPAGQAPSQTPPITPNDKTFPVNPLSVSLSSELDEPGLGNNLHLLAAVATPEGTQELTTEELLHLEATRVVAQIVISDTTMENSDKLAEEVERPFVCDVCGRKFIRATHLRRHMRIHTGEKPFACHICGRRYARGDYLRAHIQAHRRDKVHKCKHCSEIFHDLMRFADHCRTIHKDMEDEFGNVKDFPGGRSDSFSMFTDDALSEVTVGVIDSMDLTDPSSPIPIIPVTLEKSSDQVVPPRIAEVIISSTGTQEILQNTAIYTSPEFLQALSQSSHMHPTTIDQNEAQIILQNGSLSIPETANEVTVMNRQKLARILDHFP